MKKIATLLACLFLLIGCAHQQVQTKHPRMPFPVDEYAKLQKTGNSTVKGQAFLLTRGGDVKKAAGKSVFIEPLTSYSSEWYQIEYLKNKYLEAPDRRLYDYLKQTTADAEGRFVFHNMPAGAYLVRTVITWEVPSRHGGTRTTGGWAVQTVSVRESETIEVIISK